MSNPGPGMCATHLTRRAIHKCRRCGKPVCDQCASANSGRFCSAECADAFQEFQSAVSDTPVIRRRRFSAVGCLRTLVISLILSAVIWLALTQLFNTTNPAKMTAELENMIRLAF